jgi:hypothetical protein
MTRARLAAVVLTAGLVVLPGCANMNLGIGGRLFHRNGNGDACCPGGVEGDIVGSSPFEGPVLTPPEGGFPVDGGPQVMPPPRLVPAPQSHTMPYTPTGSTRKTQRDL